MSENELRHAASPYLLQHAGNSVHWRMWGPAAALPRGGGVTQKRAGRSDARAVPCQGRDLLALSQPIRF